MPLVLFKKKQSGYDAGSGSLPVLQNKTNSEGKLMVDFRVYKTLKRWVDKRGCIVPSELMAYMKFAFNFTTEETEREFPAYLRMLLDVYSKPTENRE